MFARTERLLLRPSWPEDARDLHDAIADEGIVRNLARAPWPYSEDEARRFAATEHDGNLPAFLLMLRTDGSPRLIGACGLGERNGDVELGYWISRPYWGLGFATEAGRAVVNIARAIGHRKLVAGHFADNPASGRVLRKLGFRPTGKSEVRKTKGRSDAAPSLLYERSLEDSSTQGVDRPRMFAPTIREQFEQLQAA
ncbi:MAG: GNAT family N-acetyltransferase [Sphingorhabdus sp.]